LILIQASKFTQRQETQTVKMKACLALLALVAMATSASAAKLVVIATNSGTGNPPVSGSNVPVAPAGAKGYLIGLDNSTDPVAPLAFQDLTFQGPGLVQRLAPAAAAAELIPSQNVQLRSEALAANATDGPGAPATFGGNDSWWWNQAQDGLTLAPVATGIVGGLPGGPMTMTGSYNLSGSVPAGVWRLAYLVVTADTNISGLLASGQIPFNALGENPATAPSGAIMLRYSDGAIVRVPEPSTIALASMGLVALTVGAWRRRK
jgi:hypothetical protein